MCLTIPLTPDEERQLAERAKAAGQSPDAFALGVLRRELSRAARVEQTLAEVHQDFDRSSMSDDQLSDLLEQCKHELRHQNRAKAS